MKGVRLWLAFLVLALLIVIAQLLRGHPVSWDEIEFFRATRWVSEGKVPFRDFWEHHTPLQWIVFSPLAAVFGTGPGVAAIVAMRVAQLPLWIATLAFLMKIASREQLGAASRWGALSILLASHLFGDAALEYRVDTLGNFAYIAALAIVFLCRQTPLRWAVFGALMSAAVLANMRLGPLVIATAAMMLAWRADERRWRWSPAALWMSAGVVSAAAAFVGWLLATGAWTAFAEAMFDYNVVSNGLVRELATGTLARTMRAPIEERDVAGVAMWLASFAGVVVALRGIRRPGPLQIVSLLLLASVGFVALTGIQYPYHFQNAYLLMLPLVAFVLEMLSRHRRAATWQGLALAVTGVALLLRFIPMTGPSFGTAMDYQDLVMTEVDRRTKPGDIVWDGCGYALHRQPAYRYWFLPAGVRMMAEANEIEPYDVRELATNPPAAIVFNYRLELWFRSFPRAARWTVHHYVPLYRNLWIPGLSVKVEPRPIQVAWRAPAAGRFEIYASELLARHPWFERPDEYVRIEGAAASAMEIPLRRLPPLPDGSLLWTVDGVLQPTETRTLSLLKGSRVELRSNTEAPAGVLVVPAGVSHLAMAPEARFVF